MDHHEYRDLKMERIISDGVFFPGRVDPEARISPSFARPTTFLPPR